MVPCAKTPDPRATRPCPNATCPTTTWRICPRGMRLPACWHRARPLRLRLTLPIPTPPAEPSGRISTVPRPSSSRICYHCSWSMWPNIRSTKVFRPPSSFHSTHLHFRNIARSIPSTTSCTNLVSSSRGRQRPSSAYIICTSRLCCKSATWCS